MKTPSSIIILTAMAAAPITAAALTPEAADSALYHEPYRPQYHYTPAHRWIGDPCGLLRHGGRCCG